MDDRDGSFDRFLKRLGIMVLIGVACFWAGRLTGRPETVRERRYIDCYTKVIADVYRLGLRNGEARKKCE